MPIVHWLSYFHCVLDFDYLYIVILSISSISRTEIVNNVLDNVFWIDCILHRNLKIKLFYSLTTNPSNWEWFSNLVLNRYKMAELFLDNKIEFWKLHWLKLFAARISNFFHAILEPTIITWPIQKVKNSCSKNCNQCNFQSLILLSRKKFCRFFTFQEFTLFIPDICFNLSLDPPVGEYPWIYGFTGNAAATRIAEGTLSNAVKSACSAPGCSK